MASNSVSNRISRSPLSYPHKSDIYTYRVPTPPRIVVPPPTLNADAVPEITLQALRDTSHDFLSQVDYHNVVQKNAPMEWHYEQRREAQYILPFLCLGPMTAAKDEGWLRAQGVTMLLGVRQKHHAFQSRLMSSALRVAERLGLEYHTIDLASNQDLIQAFPTTTRLINEHLARSYSASASMTTPTTTAEGEQQQQQQQLGKVLIFCESGNERSAGVVAAYVMETHEDVDFIKAMQLAQAQRFCINFDDGMKRVLQSYWDIVCARRAVTESEGGAGRSKRALSRDDDADEESAAGSDQAMDDGAAADQDDLERFSGRRFAPFVDQPF